MDFESRKRLLVFLDETGDHSLTKIDKDFPIFTLAGVAFDPADYFEAVGRFNRFKLKYFAHEGTILHSREIAGREGEFIFLNNKIVREKFLKDISDEIRTTKMNIAAGVIKKELFKKSYKYPLSPYDLAFSFVFEKIFNYACKMEFDYVQFIAESRGGKEDKELHDVFVELKAKEGFWGKIFPRYIDARKLDNIHIRLEFRKKQANVIGHQIADLVALPIARTVLKGVEHPSYPYFKDKFIFGNNPKIFPD